MLWPRAFGRLAALAVALAGFGCCLSPPLGATEVRIADNVFLVRDKPGTPLSFQMLVNAGCSDEADNQCRGLAHYLEHIVLTGRNPEH